MSFLRNPFFKRTEALSGKTRLHPSHNNPIGEKTKSKPCSPLCATFALNPSFPSPPFFSHPHPPFSTITSAVPTRHPLLHPTAPPTEPPPTTPNEPLTKPTCRKAMRRSWACRHRACAALPFEKKWRMRRGRGTCRRPIGPRCGVAASSRGRGR